MVDGGIIFHCDLSIEECTQAMTKFGAMNRNFPWWVGDMINHAHNVHGEKYTQALDMTQWEYKTLVHYAYLCKSIPYERRIPKLFPSHHMEVLKLAPSDQDRYLKKAATKEWSVRELREEVQKVLPPHKQEDRWMSFDTWWEDYKKKRKIEVDTEMIAYPHVKAAWEGALEKGIAEADK